MISWCWVSPPQLPSCLTPVLQISCLHRPASNPPCASSGDQGVVMSWWVVITPQSTNHHSLSSVIPASNPLSVSQSLIAWCWEEASDWSPGHNTGISLVKRWRRWSTTDQRQPQLRNITAIIRWQQQHYTTWLFISIGHGHLHPLGYIWQVIYICETDWRYLLTEQIVIPNDVNVEVSRFPWWLQWPVSSGQFLTDSLRPLYPGHQSKYLNTSHSTLRAPAFYFRVFLSTYFLRGLLKSLKSCDVTKVFGFSVKLVFRRKRHKAIRIWCVLEPRRRESQNLVRMGSWGGRMLNDHLYASFGKITLGNRLFTIFGDSFCLETSNKWDDLNSFRPHKNLWIKCSGLN